MRFLLALVLLWTGCTLNNGDLMFIDGDAICVTREIPGGPTLDCWR